jgi:hypothetical protein
MVSLIATSIIIIVSLLFIALVFYAIFKSHTTHVNPPPPDKHYQCPTVPITALRKCDPTNQSACQECCVPGAEGSCKPEPYYCVTVDKDHPMKWSINPDVNCAKTPQKCVDIPDGSWCLPVKVESDHCNAFTSIPVLSRINPGLWRWRCDCKYPELVTKNNLDADCTSVIACDPIKNPDNTIVCPPLTCNPKCDPGTEVCCGGRCRPISTCDPKCKDGETCCDGNCYSLPCTPGQPWTEDPTWDPVLYGVRKCHGAGERPFKRYDTVTGRYMMECVNDFCAPGGSYDSDDNTCKCDPKTGTPGKGDYSSWVNCPEDVQDHSGSGGINFKESCPPVGSACTDGQTCDHQCVKDPCNPLGYFDKTSGKCVCDGSPYAAESQDLASPVGSICTDMCDGPGGKEPNAPCGGLKLNNPLHRGTCYINDAKEPKCHTPCDHANGYIQGPNGLCEGTCTTTGNDCSDDECCPGLGCHNDYCPDGFCKICG